jgi:hypothetical protein
MPYKDYEKQLQNSRKTYQRNKDFLKKRAIERYYENYEVRKIQKKLWQEKNKDKLKQYRKKYFQNVGKNRIIENKARRLLNNAVRDKIILRPDFCEDCEQGGIIHGHHEDYNKPLKVIWLCHACHFKRHRKVIK